MANTLKLYRQGAVRFIDWLEPLVTTQVIGLHEFAFSYRIHAALESVLWQVAVSSFDYSIISANALKKDKSMMVKQAASLKEYEPGISRLTGEHKPKRLSVPCVALGKRLISRSDLATWVPLKPEPTHSGIDAIEAAHYAKLSLNKHTGEPVA